MKLYSIANLGSFPSLCHNKFSLIETTRVNSLTNFYFFDNLKTITNYCIQKGNSLSFVFNWEYLEIYDTGNIEEKKAVKIPELKKHLQERIISTNFIDTQFFDTNDCCKKDVEQFEYSYLRLILKDEKDFAYIFLVILGFFNL